MISLIGVPKPFRGHVGMIQTNALRSWTLLGRHCEVVLLGDEDGTKETARTLDVAWGPSLATDRAGSPILSDVLLKADRLASHEVVAFVNADIVLTPDFARAAERVAQITGHFLMTGRRWNLEVEEPLDFGDGWEGRLRDRVTRHGALDVPWALDYFVYRRGFWGEVPPLVIGRLFWDNWLLFRARQLRAMVIDATRSVLAVHQEHDYSHIPGASDKIPADLAQRNLELAGGWDHVFTLRDATHVLVDGRVERALHPWRLWRRMAVLPTLRPAIGWLVQPLLWLNNLLRPLRLGLGFQVAPRDPP